jgi:hypothetical protein
MPCPERKSSALRSDILSQVFSGATDRRGECPCDSAMTGRTKSFSANPTIDSQETRQEYLYYRDSHNLNSAQSGVRELAGCRCLLFLQELEVS